MKAESKEEKKAEKTVEEEGTEKNLAFEFSQLDKNCR